MGIDPGRHFGITIIQSDRVDVVWGTFPSASHEEYGRMAYDVLPFVFLVLEGDIPKWDIFMKQAFCYVEGAAYHDTYGQVGLAEVRFGFYLGMEHLGIRCKYIAPMSARKVAFGSAKIKAPDLWPVLNKNAADSVGIAMAAWLKHPLRSDSM